MQQTTIYCDPLNHCRENVNHLLEFLDIDASELYSNGGILKGEVPDDANYCKLFLDAFTCRWCDGTCENEALGALSRITFAVISAGLRGPGAFLASLWPSELE